MQFTKFYTSPLGRILLAADEDGLSGLWFEGQKYFARGLGAHEERETPVLTAASEWLRLYFSGQRPDAPPPLHAVGTPFQRDVWGLLCEIPYGQTTTYAALAAELAARRGLARMSARAVGSAIGRNPISIFIPCHRVVGTGGSLTGYAGGIDRKILLLTLEGVELSGLYVPGQARRRSEQGSAKEALIPSQERSGRDFAAN